MKIHKTKNSYNDISFPGLILILSEIYMTNDMKSG